MDKPMIIGELAKIKYFADQATSEIQKDGATQNTIKTTIDPIFQSLQIITQNIMNFSIPPRQ